MTDDSLDDVQQQRSADAAKKSADLYKDIADRPRAQARQSIKIALLKAAFALVLIPAFIYWHAFALATLWAWFGEPVFHLHLSVFYAAGLTLFFRMLLPHGLLVKRQDYWSELSTNLSLPALALGFGAVWHWLQWGL